MGRCKLLLPWRDTTILGHLVRQWRSLGAEQLATVCAHDSADVQLELARLGISKEQTIFNPVPERGMFSSIQCAAEWPRWQTGLTHWALVLGDQPHLQLETLQGLLAFSAAGPDRICQTACAGRRGHPVLLPRAAFTRLPGSSSANLKEFLQASEVALYPANDPGLLLDIDSPSDYEKLSRSGTPMAGS
jgi:molybdenum cofactor cytidylyltransferase